MGTDWYERGRTLLADSQRAESLKAAAMQLRRLSGNNNNMNSGMGLGMNSGMGMGINDGSIHNHGHGHTHGRRGSHGALTMNSMNLNNANNTTNKMDVDGNTEGLAEWEILAVDRQIRDSIKNLFSRDWSRKSVKNAPPREGESLHPAKKMRGIGISAGKSSNKTSSGSGSSTGGGSTSGAGISSGASVSSKDSASGGVGSGSGNGSGLHGMPPSPIDTGSDMKMDG